MNISDLNCRCCYKKQENGFSLSNRSPSPSGRGRGLPAAPRHAAQAGVRVGKAIGTDVVCRPVADRIRVLGVDAALRVSGTAIVEALGSNLRAVDYAVIRSPSPMLSSQCLARLYTAVQKLIADRLPDAVAIEGGFYCRNVKTAVVLGEARGAVIAACANSGVPVHEYSPRRVKQSVAGSGSAGKEQVKQMVKSILGLRDELCEDESDALAVAICHAHSAAGRLYGGGAAI